MSHSGRDTAGCVVVVLIVAGWIALLIYGAIKALEAWPA